MLRAMNSYKFLSLGLGASLELSEGKRSAVAWRPGLGEGRVDLEQAG